MTSVHALPSTVPARDIPSPANGHWTYSDYCLIPDDGRCYELIAGVLYVTPAPNRLHQNAVAAITTHLRIHVDFSGRGKVYPSPFDVRLDQLGTVVQPDVVVVLNGNRQVLTDAGVTGAPDLVVEVSSPGTATYDRRTKMDAYRDAGVAEYWIVDPHAETVELFTLELGEYASAGVFQGESTLPSLVVPAFPVTVGEFFA